MKWMSKKTETPIITTLFIAGLIVFFSFQSQPVAVIGFVSSTIAYVRLIELYLFDLEFKFIEKIKCFFRARKGKKK
jgi:hypothetical protein